MAAFLVTRSMSIYDKFGVPAVYSIYPCVAAFLVTRSMSYDKFGVPAGYSICVQIPITKLNTYTIKHGNWAKDK